MFASFEEALIADPDCSLFDAVDVLVDQFYNEHIYLFSAISVKILLKEFNLETFRLDTGKTYILFWFNGLSIDRCSRSSDFRYAHFEYELDLLGSKYKVENVLLYDSIQYRKQITVTTSER